MGASVFSRAVRQLAWLGGCSGLVLAIGAAAVPSSPVGSVSGFAGELRGVAVVSGADAWAVGDAPTSSGGSRALVLHWNGTRWTKVASPAPGINSLLNGVSAISPSDVWAVGSFSTSTAGGKTLVLHWNGIRWTRVPSPTPEAVDGSFLQGVSALSPSDVWAAGFVFGTGGESSNTLALHWNGVRWTRVTSPNPSAGSFNELLGVSGSSAHDVWASGDFLTTSGGQRTLLLHWNGARWARVASPNQAANGFFNAVSDRSASDAWAAGEFSKSLIAHWNGSQWESVANPGPSGSALNGISARSTSDAWTVGSVLLNGGKSGTLILRWNGTKWARVASQNPGGVNGTTLSAVATLSGSDAWAVGSFVSSTSQQRVLILHWNGSRWLRS